MPLETLIVVAAVFGIFGAFGIAVGYVNLIAREKAITFEEERLARGH